MNARNDSLKRLPDDDSSFIKLVSRTPEWVFKLLDSCVVILLTFLAVLLGYGVYAVLRVLLPGQDDWRVAAQGFSQRGANMPGLKFFLAAYVIVASLVALVCVMNTWAESHEILTVTMCLDFKRRHKHRRHKHR